MRGIVLNVNMSIEVYSQIQDEEVKVREINSARTEQIIVQLKQMQCARSIEFKNS
ncbi:MAG: hypothetical protein QXJ68_02605 [Methanocellales archaeon]